MKRILVLCTGNSCRSIMAEALINALGAGRYEAVSAGSNPAGYVHPKSIETLKRHGISISNPRSKSWDEFADQHFDLVITVCDAAASESCPAFLGKHQKLHWSTPDPAKATGTEDEINAAFDEAFAMLKKRVKALVAMIIDMKRFNNNAYIEERVDASDSEDQGSLKTALRYLYLDDGPINLPRKRQKIAEKYLDEVERILIRWLATRTNGSERKNYGSRALIAARSVRYRCQQCGFPDVRCLNLDHIDGRVDGAEFACLCANCHTIKSRQKDWSGKALRQKDEDTL